jgi:hypothetical protein
MHRRAGVVDRHLVGADELGREGVLDAAVGVGDVHAGLANPAQLVPIFHAAHRPRGAVPAGNLVGCGLVVGLSVG